MIQPTHQTRILLGVVPADFRCGIDGFVARCQNQLLLDPRDQSVFVFINRAKTMIRALSYDGTGYWLMTKRLSRGKFTGWPSGDRAVSDTTALQLRHILGGTSWKNVEPESPSCVLASAAPSATLNANKAAAPAP